MTDPEAADRAFSRSAYPVFAIVGVLALIHLLRLSLDPDLDFRLLGEFAFTPANFSLGFDAPGAWSAAREAIAQGRMSAAEAALLVGQTPRWWTLATYSLLHGGFAHIALNSVWLLAFGVAVCRRFGPLRFLLFYAFAAVAGALAFYVAHPFGLDPVIGASGAISGAMGAAVRFAFAPGAPLGAGFARARDLAAYRRPAPGLREVLTEGRALTFIVLWFAGNYIFGVYAPIGADGASIAWQAHIGGFVAGFLGFSLFDRKPSADVG